MTLETVGHEYDVESTHLLCGALKRRTELQALGYTVVLFTETHQERFVLYFLAYRLTIPKPTRTERGANGIHSCD